MGRADRGAKFWLKVFNELKTRGCQDILIAVVDGLKGLADAIETAFPRTTVQTCIVHLIRNSLITRDGRIARPLPPRCARSTRPPARWLPNRRCRRLPTGHGAKYPMIVAWQRAWENVTPFFVFPPDIRRVIYTTNAIESLNMQLRKIIKTRSHFHR